MAQSSMSRWTHVAVCWCFVISIFSEQSSAAQAADEPHALAFDSSELEWGPCPSIFPSGCEIAVLHGDPAKPDADVFLKVPAGYVLPPHWHTSPERMVLVSGELHVEYDERGAFVLRPGTYAYGPAKAPHRASCSGAEPCVLFIAFESPVDAHAATGSP